MTGEQIFVLVTVVIAVIAVIAFAILHVSKNRHRIKRVILDRLISFKTYLSKRHVRGVDQDEDRQNILRELVSIGHGMGFIMIAEFVENDAEHRAVRKLGFQGVQGYQLGRPVALE